MHKHHPYMNTPAASAATLPRMLLRDPALRKLAQIAPPLFFELALGIGVGLIGTVLAARAA